MATSDSNHIAAIILAAGKSSRFNGDKLSITINNRPLIHHLVNTFSSQLNSIYIITNSAFTHPNIITSPNHNGDRNDSIRIGLSLLKPEINKIIIHDAARPYISQTSISRLIHESSNHLYAQFYLPVTNGLVNHIGDQFITAERTRFKQLCTPLMIDRALAGYIYNYVIDKKTLCYDPIEFLSAHKIKPMLIRGNAQELHKITYEDDL